MRLGFLSTALFASMLLATPALADGLSGMGADLFGNYFHFPRPNLDRPKVKSITVGSMRLTLQHTRLSEIRAMFGGTIMSEGSDKTLATWLCYQTDGKKGQATDTWFISNVLGGGEFVMIVAVEVAPMSGMPADCTAAPAKFVPPNMGIPGIGASSADLDRAFGASGFGGQVTYRADEPGADALGTSSNAQYIAYKMSGDRVAAYGAGETSVPAAPKSP